MTSGIDKRKFSQPTCRSAWMLEIPAFQFSRFPEVAVTGELHVQTAACTAAELPIGNFSVRSLAPSRINRPGRIPVQTAAEKLTTQDYRCVQRDEVNLWPATEPLSLYRCYPLLKALNASTCIKRVPACKRQPRTLRTRIRNSIQPTAG